MEEWVALKSETGGNISNFCALLKGDEVRPIDNQGIVELELTSEINRYLNSPIIMVDDHEIRRMLCRLKTGKLLSWGTRFMDLINDDEVKKGTKLLFKNNDGDIKKHPDKNVFYKIIEAPDVQARFE